MATYWELEVDGLNATQSLALHEFIIASDRTGVEGLQINFNKTTGVFNMHCGGSSVDAFATAIATRLANVSGRALLQNRSRTAAQSRYKRKRDR